MSEVTEFLEKSGVLYFSSVGLDNKPKVRPFGYMLEKDKKIYFCTSNDKKVFEEMQKNPWVEICASGENYSWIRLAGKVVFSSSNEIKNMILDSKPMVKAVYKSAENPNFEVFYLDEASAYIFSMGSNEPKIFNL